MIIEDDWYGKFGTCIACGHVHETQVADPKEILEEEPEEEEELLE